MVGLNAKELKFVELIVANVPQFKAYTDAGYKAKSRNVADSMASKLVRKPKIAQAIESVQQKAFERTETTAERVIGRMWAEALTTSNPPAVRVRALELLGKRLKLWNEDSPLPAGKTEVVVKIVCGKASFDDL